MAIAWRGMCLGATWKIHSEKMMQRRKMMPKNNRRDTADSSVPLIAFDEVTFEKVTFKLSWTVLANLREYVAYVKEATGNETSPDEVVDKGMQRLFNSDKGFQKWLKSQNSSSSSAKKDRRKIPRTNVEGELAAGNILNEKLDRLS